VAAIVIPGQPPGNHISPKKASAVFLTEAKELMQQLGIENG